MHKICRNAIRIKRIGLLLLPTMLLAVIAANAQQKIGLNPTSINKSSVLELESTKQGFLLPRLTDTTAINALTPPNGTMIYYSDATPANAGIYIRRTVGSTPGWYKLAYNAEDRSWAMSGNTINPSLFPKALMGTINQRSLSIITNNLVRIAIDSASGKVSVTDSLAVGGAFSAAGYAKLGGKLSVADSALFAGHIKASKNVSVTDTLFSKVAKFTDSLYLTKLKGLSNLNTVLVHDTVTGTVERRNMPSDVFKGWVLGNVDTSSFSTALERITGQGLNKDTLLIHGATFTAPGVITTGTQPIAGTKVLRDSLLVGGLSTDKPTSTLQVGGSVSVSVQSVTASTTLNQTHHTVVADGNITVTLPAAATSKGRVYVIKAVNDISKVDTNKPVNIVGTIDGVSVTSAAPMTLFIPGAYVKLQSSGVAATGWYIIP
ncbi:hypothetical protein [Filimonas effusa]|uniref:Uncharacterized protein n=1 Tax=Filimonas effusa TaxID=2508721 RepID=A0A4Q1D1G8_9BACT|nr:hypothetical protein [Filimonas effusa]RXK80829.1 hypothetical protein ESB13_21985 [Filimonas effusa]